MSPNSSRNVAKMSQHTQNGAEDTHNGGICTPNVRTERSYEEPRFKMKASERQIGGNHYTKSGIQPRDYARANNFVYEEVLALRYLTRHREKNGKKDLLKLIHCIELLIEAEYGE